MTEHKNKNDEKTWVLQSNLVNESQVRPFAEAFRDQAIKFVDVAIVPFADRFMDEPIAGSTYRLNGARCVDRETDPLQLMIAQSLADAWLPHPVCVMDVARTKDAHKVVEFNCLNASGVYDHDVPAIVRAVTDWFVSGNQAANAERAETTRRSAAQK